MESGLVGVIGTLSRLEPIISIIGMDIVSIGMDIVYIRRVYAPFPPLRIKTAVLQFGDTSTCIGQLPVHDSLVTAHMSVLDVHTMDRRTAVYGATLAQIITATP